MAESDFWEKFFFRPKIPEICRKSPFLQIFIGLIPYIFVVFHTKTLLITIPTIKNGSIVNKTDFWIRNFLKIAGTADFRRKSGISLISRAALYIFSWNFAHWCKMAIPKIWGRPIFEKLFFSAENAGNMPENRFFGIFSRFHHLFFLIFCTKTRISNAQNIAESNFYEHFFSGRKCRKSPSLQIFFGLFFTYFVVFFTQKH